MKMKVIGILIALALAVASCLIIAAAVEANGGATWYVDGNLGTDDASHGTGPGADAFLTIQYAINTIDADDTINVAAGTYNEDLTIEKSLTLQGAGAAVTSITGLLPTIVSVDLGYAGGGGPLAESVVFDGFTGTW